MPWYEGLAAVPGIKYTSSPNIQRARLPGYNLRPRIERSDYNGRQHENLFWHYPDGTTSSASPASSWASQSLPDEASPQAIIHHLYEVLELPGEASDYHFAIQGCNERLWSMRHTYPSVIRNIETLAWLDIRLLEALPDMLRHQHTDGTVFYARSLAFERLIYLYQRNGYLAEALDVAQRATRFHADDTILQPLRERLARLEAEQ